MTRHTVFGDWRDLRGAIERANPDWASGSEETRKLLWDFAEAVIGEYAPLRPICDGCKGELSWSAAYRCADCRVVYCETCIRAHFAESKRFAAKQALIDELVEGLEPFNRAAPAFGDDPGPIRFYTDTGYREIPLEDFRRARALISKARSSGKAGSDA